jgi:NUMOD3 motif
VFCTYAHYTPQGRLFYIGKGSSERRAYYLSGRNKHWHNVVNKYGKPDVQILANWDTEEEALDHERLLISCFRDLGHKLCNLTDGGEGVSGLKHSEETRKKMSFSRLGKTGHKCSEETKQKLREVNLGNKHSEKTKEKLSALNKGLKNSLGYKHTEEAKKKIGAASKGNKHGIGNTNKRKFVWIGTHIKTGEIIHIIGQKAMSDGGFQSANIIKCINGSIKSHKGYSWTKELIG